MSETPDPRFCICVSIPPESFLEQVREVMTGLLDCYFGEGGNPGDNPIPLVAVPIALKSIDLLLRSGLVEEAGKLVKSLIEERSKA